MRRRQVTPSQVIQHIEETFFEFIEHNFSKILLTPVNLNRLAGITGLIDQIPIEFITLPDDDRIDFLSAKEGLRSEVDNSRVNPQARRYEISRSFKGMSSLETRTETPILPKPSFS